jgi:hypothetical protein
MTPSRCTMCHGPRVETRDALGRVRVRCPRCQGVAREAGAAQPGHEITQQGRAAIPLPRAPRAVRSTSPASVRTAGDGQGRFLLTCVVCGGVFARPVRPGRPPKHCPEHPSAEQRRYAATGRGPLSGVSA